MGFYGDLTSINKTQFVFDKTYANRALMDASASEDGVFIGRYVLVNYGEGLPKGTYTELYLKNGQFYFSSNNKRAKYIDESYYVINGGRYEINQNRVIADGVFLNEPVYVLDKASGTYDFYRCTGMNGDYATFVNMPNADVYYENFIIDKNTYGIDTGGINRGYDATVWKKVYADNTQKYILVAELNSSVPIFNLVVDAPTAVPEQPHFDTDSTDINYQLHMQPAWGFQVKNASEKENSDVTVGKQRKAIFYNKSGFDAEYHNESNDTTDLITVTADGVSGNKYNIHKNGSQYKTEAPDIQQLTINLPSIGNTISKVWDLAYGEGEEVIEGGKTVFRRNKEVDWNTITGLRLVKENPDGTGFDYLPEQTSTIAGCINSVHDLMGMIIASQISTIENNKEVVQNRLDAQDALDNRIYYGNYEPDRKIVVNIDDGSGGTIEQERLYKGYYIKNLSYTYTPLKTGETIENITKPIKVTLIDFAPNTYYYKFNNNYYLEENQYHSGNQYCLFSLINNINFYSEDYVPDKYFVKESDGKGGYIYIKEKALTPDPKKIYYDFGSNYKDLIIDYSDWDPDTKLTSSKSFFFPTNNDSYFKTYFKTIEHNGGKEIDGYVLKSGLFYEEDGTFYPYTSPINDLSKTLYWIKNYRYEKSVTDDGVVNTYEVDKEGTEKIKLKLVEFKPNMYYYETENGFYSLNSLDAVQQREYFSLSSNVKEIKDPFYLPNLYYYQDGNDYIFATESKKIPSKKYYEIISQNIPNGERCYVEAGVNYYTDVNLTTIGSKLKYDTIAWNISDNHWIINVDGAVHYVKESDVQRGSVLFYESNKYYYKNGEKYIIDKNASKTKGRQYYKINYLYVIKDDNGIYNLGAKWNSNVTTIPTGVTLGTRENAYEWKELVGFARTINTIHGLILSINNLIKFDDQLSRDTNTIQGCINALNDIISIFGDLKPGQILVVDDYGRISNGGSLTDLLNRVSSLENRVTSLET